MTGIPRRWLVTGGAGGFIGSHFVRRVLARHPEVVVTVLDKLTYAGNLANLAEVADHPRYRFVHGDISDPQVVTELVQGADAIVNFAAESHVDRSINAPDAFIEPDIHGTFNLLEAARKQGCARSSSRSAPTRSMATCRPGWPQKGHRSVPAAPYSASKAGADLLVGAYQATYGVPATITRSTNNFGPNQYTEKVIPLVHHECPRRRALAGVRRWPPEPRMALRGRPLRRP